MSTHRCMRTPDKSKETINQFRQAPHRRNLSDPRPRLESQTQDPDPNWEQHNRIQGHDCSAGCLRSCQKLVPVHVVNQKTIDNFLISHAGVGASSRNTVGCQGGLQILGAVGGLESWRPVCPRKQGFPYACKVIRLLQHKTLDDFSIRWFASCFAL